MNERERVLDLVKKGVLSTEEALDLLENMARDKDERQIKKEASEMDEKKDQAARLVDEWEKPEEIKADADHNEDEEKEMEQLLDDLATEANRLSVEIDEVDAEIKGVKAEIKEHKEKVMEINTKEDLETITDDDVTLRQELEKEVADLAEKLDDLTAEKIQLEGQLRNVRKGQWEDKKESFNQKFDIPEDLKDQATETFNQMGEKLGEAGLQFGNLVKKTLKGVSDALEDNVEWKDLSVKVPGIAATKFEHEFLYEDTTATLIDVKLANGKVTFKAWDSEDIKVAAKVKLFGKMNEATPLDSLMARSQIEVNDEKISFHIPNKRVAADLVFYLPKRTYDHVSVKLLNGNFTVEELSAKDVFAKSSNGTITFKEIKATMLEVQGVNGNIEIQDGQILDTIIDTVNGTVTSTADIQNYGVSLVNGDIKITAKNNDLAKIQAHSVNGNIKVALPTAIGLEGNAKTSLGSINRRLENYEVIREKKDKTNQMLQFRRVVGEEIAYIDLATTTGTIFIKDSEK